MTRLLGVALIAVALVGCDSDPKGLSGPLPNTFLTVDPPFLSIDEGETTEFTAFRAGQPATVTWESSDPTVATVSSTGFVTSLKGGFTAITATAANGEKRSASLNVAILTGTALVDGVGVGVSSDGEAGDTQLFRIFVPEGSTNLTVTLSGGTGDADLYVRRGTPPTPSVFDCRPFLGGNNETCSFTNPQKGTWYIMIEQFDPYAGATLTANVTP